MTNPFLSSEEYDERAHALYNEGQYDEAIDLLREGLALYPGAVELHVGAGYARLAREEYVWARKSFDEALVLDPEHEDALAGMGEVLLKFGQIDAGFRAFERTVELGYDDDVDLMLQIGRALFREGFVETALTYFEKSRAHAADSAEAVACIGYAQHRLGLDSEAIASLQQALALDDSFAEARVYLANLLYDAGDLEGALKEFERTTPGDHWDELGIWRLMELKKQVYKLADDDGEFRAWEARLTELAGEPDAIDDLLADIEQTAIENEQAAQSSTTGASDALGTLLSGLAGQQGELPMESQGERQGTDAPTDLLMADASTVGAASGTHRVVLRDGTSLEGSWEEIVRALRDRRDAGRPLDEYMALEARRTYGATGMQIASHAPEAFLRGSADAGVLRIVR